MFMIFSFSFSISKTENVYHFEEGKWHLAYTPNFTELESLFVAEAVEPHIQLY